MAIARTTYTTEFKLQAVKMITEQHLSVTEVARRLGVPAKRLHEWKTAVREHGAGAFPGGGHRPPPGGRAPPLAGRREAAGDGA